MDSNLWDIKAIRSIKEIVQEFAHYWPNSKLVWAKIYFQQIKSLQRNETKQNTHSFGLASTGGGSFAGESKTAGGETDLSPFGLLLITPFTP